MEVKPLVEKIITWGKDGDVHALLASSGTVI